MRITEKVLQIYERPGRYLADKFVTGSTSEKVRLLNEEISGLSGSSTEAVREYHLRKMEEILLTLTIILLLCIAEIPLAFRGADPVPEGKLKRDSYGGMSYLENLRWEIEGESEADLMEVTVHERQHTKQELRGLLKNAQKEFMEHYLADNLSAQEVRGQLFLPGTLQGGQVRATYVTIPYGIISDSGEIAAEIPDEGSLVTIRAEFSSQGEQLECEMAVQVLPRELTEYESRRKTIGKALREADEKSASEEWLQLPNRAEGNLIHWYKVRGKQFLLLPLLLVVLPFLIFFGKDNRIHEEAERRKQQLQEEYSEFLWKMTMLLGAGMNIRGTFVRVTADYKEEKRETGKENYLYRELLRSCTELRNGVSEAAVYETFGRRCGLPEYIRLGTVLSQNLRKGDRQLAGILEKEAMMSLQIKKNAVRKRGEQAAVKMLFPMMMMLGVVLAILMIPALMTM